MPELEKVIERKLRDGVKKLGGGAQCLKFERDRKSTRLNSSH